MTEKQLLKKLDIPDWRYLSKDKSKNQKSDDSDDFIDIDNITL